MFQEALPYLIGLWFAGTIAGYVGGVIHTLRGQSAETVEDDPLEIPLCKECGSPNISFDANAWWNFGKQEFEYDPIDNVYCEDCPHTGSPKWEVSK